MRINLIYGENITPAYEKYRKTIDSAKNKGFEIISIKSPRDVVGQFLFHEKIVFVLEKPKKIKLADWKWLGKSNSKYNSNLLIYWEGNIPASVIKNFGKEARKEKFDLPKMLFAFLDNIYPGNSSKALKLLNSLVKNEPIELVFHLLARRMRDLYWIKTAPKTMMINSWQESKLMEQANKFEIYVLKSLLDKLARIDIESKTSDIDLKRSLDIWIVENLK